MRRTMPIGAQDNLERLYAIQRMLADEAARLETASEALATEGSDADRRYILRIEIDALREESSRLSSRIADILERDLER